MASWGKYIFSTLPLIQGVLWAGPLEVTEQGWSIWYDDVVDTWDFADYHDFYDEAYRGDASPIVLSDAHEREGRIEALTDEGMSFLDFSTESEQGLRTAVRSEKFESEISIYFNAEWAHDHFLSGGDSAFNYDYSASGYLRFSLSEASEVVLSTAVDVDSLSSTLDGGIHVTFDISIRSDEEESALTFRKESGGFIEAAGRRYIRLEPGDYSLEVNSRLEAFTSGNGGYVFSEGLGHIHFILLARSLAAPEESVGLSLESPLGLEQLRFRPSNMSLADAYELQASPDLDFSDAQILDYVRRNELQPEIEVDISRMGPQQFFRLVRVQD